MRPAPEELPWCFEPGTQSHEGMAGTEAAVDYFGWIGETMSEGHQSSWSHFDGRRKHVHAAMDCLFDYERALSEQLIAGLQSIPGVTVQGITAPEALDRRVPTVAFTHAGMPPSAISDALAARNIFVWSGHNYAVETAMSLGIYDHGGAVRVGPVHYNSPIEINKLLNSLEGILRQSRIA